LETLLLAEKEETMSGSPSPPSRLPIWMLILATPLVCGVVIAYLFHNVWPGLLTWIGGLVAILIASFITGVGQQIQSTLVPHIFALGYNSIQGTRYEQGYRRRVLSEHRFLDITSLPAKPGKGFQLANVFVQPYLVNKLIQQTSTDLIKPPDSCQGEPQSIWDYLKTKEHLVILGIPGSGKTTLLRHVALELSEKRNRRKLPISNPHSLPFLLFLRNYGEVIKDSSAPSLVEVIEAELSKWEKPPSGWVEHQLTRKGSLVLLDGLDEVADETTRRSVMNWVQLQMTACDQSQFVLTSRPYGYKGNELSSPTVLEVQSFSPEQISKCIERWYLEWLTTGEGQQGDEVRMEARKKAEDLRRRMRRKPGLWKLAINPFLLHLIATVHNYGNTLPEKRVELYNEICKIFLGKRDEARNILHPLSPSQQQWVLENLAYQLMLRGELTITREQAEMLIAASLTEVDPTLPPRKFLDLVETRSGLLREKELGVYGFAHKAFQEYLAAVYIGGERGNVQELVDRIGDDWWHETILLYCAQNDATPLIEACLAGSSPSISMLRLALECRNEAQRMKLGTRTRLDRLISQEAADQDPISRQDLAEALLGNRLSDNQLVPLSEAEDAFVSPSLINCIEYQLFLDEQQGDDAEQGSAPDHWKDIHFPPGYGQYPVLGIRPSDATSFCTWLTDRERNPWRYRLPKSDELQEIRTQLVGTGKPPPGCGFWKDSGRGFARMEQGTQGLTEHLFQERLAQDRDKLMNASRGKESDDIAACVNAVQELVHIRAIHNDLVRTLVHIRNRLGEQAKDMQSKYAQAEVKVSDLTSRLQRVQDEQFALRANQVENSPDSQYNEWTDDSALRSIKQNFNDLDTKINQVEMELGIAERERTDYQNSYEHEERRWFLKNQRRMNSLQDGIAARSTQIQALEAQRTQYLRDQAQQQKRERRAKARATQVRISPETNRRGKETIEADLENLRKQATDITANLKQAQEQQGVLQKQLVQLTAHLRHLSSICDNVLAFALSYDQSQSLTSALAQNAALNFDVVLLRSGLRIRPAMLVSFLVVNRHIRDLVAAVTQFVSTASSDIDNRELSNLTSLSHELTQVHEHVTFQHNIELLVDTLHSFLAELITHHPLGRATPLLRAAIRHSAWELAECLSYWLGKKQVSPLLPTNLLKVRDAYIDIAVTLALLEERIEGKLPPIEGIVLVRERRQQASRES